MNSFKISGPNFWVGIIFSGSSSISHRVDYDLGVRAGRGTLINISPFLKIVFLRYFDRYFFKIYGDYFLRECEYFPPR